MANQNPIRVTVLISGNGSYNFLFKRRFAATSVMNEMSYFLMSVQEPISKP